MIVPAILPVMETWAAEMTETQAKMNIAPAILRDQRLMLRDRKREDIGCPLIRKVQIQPMPGIDCSVQPHNVYNMRRLSRQKS